MLWDIVGIILSLSLWIYAGYVMWHEKPYQAQETEELPIGPLVEPTPDAFPLYYRSPYTGEHNA